MADAAKKIAESSAVPANVKTQFDALNKEFEAVRKKFGVPLNAAPAGGRGGGGGRGGAAVDPENVLGRTSSLRDGDRRHLGDAERVAQRQYNDVKVELPKAITEANAWLARADAMSADAEEVRHHADRSAVGEVGDRSDDKRPPFFGWPFVLRSCYVPTIYAIVARGRIELPTRGFSVRCSTN